MLAFVFGTHRANRCLEPWRRHSQSRHFRCVRESFLLFLFASLLDNLCWLLYQRYSNPRSPVSLYDNFANKESERLLLIRWIFDSSVAGVISMTCSIVDTLEGRKKMFVAINRFFAMRKSYARKSLKQIIRDFFIRRVGAAILGAS